jgi:hypothetical protein
MLFKRLLALTLIATSAIAQPKPPVVSKALPATATTDQRLPVKKVVLYKNGVGYFEHEQRVRGSQDLSINFTISP